MENKVCCCFGHREANGNLSDQLEVIIEHLIVNKGVKTFFTGGMGQFDRKFSVAVRAKQKTYPDIKLILVYPYMTRELTVNQKWYEANYDSILIPYELMGKHYKSAITERNQWLVNHSDYVVAHVYCTFGGAYQAVRYAERKNKEIYRVT